MARTILIVEDSADDAELLQRTLLQASLLNPLRIVNSCVEAIAYIKGAGRYSDRDEHPEPGIIFVDLKLPGMDGVEFLEWLKTYPKNHEMIAFAISGSTDFMSIRRAYKAGASSFVTKPFDCADLEVLIDGFPGPWSRAASLAPPKTRHL